MDQAYKVKVQLAYRICQHYVKLIEKNLNMKISKCHSAEATRL